MAPLADAVEKLTQDAMTEQSNVLSSKPFRRRSVLKALYAKLGIQTLEWRQDNIAMAPLDLSNTPENVTASSSDPFGRHCSSCHSNASQFPPVFMNGSPEQIKLKLSQCRQKFLQRLSMWQGEIEERQMSPMPPVHWLLASGISEREWKQSDALGVLLAVTNELADRSNSESGSANDLCL